jgi:hypothetical protein
METKRFKTRTIYEPRQNGQIQGVFPIAIDVGYSSVKVMSPVCVASFPAFAKQTPNLGTIGELPADRIYYKDLETEEEGWLVGSHAQIDTSFNEALESDQELFGRNRIFSPMFKVIARVGLGIALLSNKHGQKGNRKIVVQTGLPPAWAQGDSRYLREVLAGRHHFRISVGSKEPQEFDFTLEGTDINIIMQPMGTLYSAFKDSTNRFSNFSKDELDKNILIFDAGFNTFDLNYIANHSVKNSETFSDLGMKRVFQETIGKINKTYGANILSVTDMQKYLNDGTVTIYDRRAFSTKKEPFGDMLEESSNKICEEAVRKMAQIYPIQDIDYLIITGGTGAAWEHQIRDMLKDMSTLKIISGHQSDTSLPMIFSNVRGYYMYRCSVLESKFGPLTFNVPESEE